MKKQTVNKKAKPDKEKIYAQLLQDVAEGLSLRKACAKHKISPFDFRLKMRKDETLQAQYTQAREDSTDSMLDEFNGIMEDLRANKIDSSTARVLLDALKWRLCKFYPKMYGDRQQTQFVDEKGNGINPFDAFYKAVCEKKDYTR